MLELFQSWRWRRSAAPATPFPAGDLGNGTKLVLVPAGKFMMGSADREVGRQIDEGPVHEVTISKPFQMGFSNVTRGQFAAFVRQTGYKTDAEKGGLVVAWDGFDLKMVKGASWTKPGFDQADDHPVVCVSHDDAMAYCAWLSRKTGRTVTLPTEAQFEYAARGHKHGVSLGRQPRRRQRLGQRRRPDGKAEIQRQGILLQLG